MSGISKEKKFETTEKKQIIAKKMGGTQNADKPNSWSKKIESRNKGHQFREDDFSKGERKTIKKSYTTGNGKEPAHSWET